MNLNWYLLVLSAVAVGTRHSSVERRGVPVEE